MEVLCLIALFLPVLTGFIAGCLKQDRLRNGVVLISLLIQVFVAVMLIMHPVSEFELLRFTDSIALVFGVDVISMIFLLLISVLWLLAAVYSFEYMKHEDHRPRYFLFYMLTLAALMGLSMAKNLVTMYLCYEMMTLLSVPLVLHTQSKEAISAGLKYLGYSVFGAGLGLLGIFFINHFAATLAFVPGGSLVPELIAGNENLLYTVYLLMMIGFGCKAGMFPLHAWLPAAHPIAPSPASALLSGVITKGGVLAIIRVTYFVFGASFLQGSFAQTICLGLAIFTIFMGSMLAYKEKVLKKRLAYSTVSQVSYVLFALFLMTPLGLIGAILQIIYHALAKNMLFLSAGSIIYKTGLKRVDEYKGLGKQMPFVMIIFTIASLSLIGIPPLGGFVSKWYIAQGAFSNPLGLLGIAVLMISALLTAGYTLPIIIDAFFPGSAFNYKKLKKNDVNILMGLPLGILAVILIVCGLFPKTIMDSLTLLLSALF